MGRHKMSLDIAKQKILDNVPLAELVGESIQLTRKSGRPVGCCPFHGEKTGSFTIYDDHYHCFGCQAHGDAIDFVRKHLGMGFREALKFLAEKYNIAVPEWQDNQKSFAEAQKRSRQYKALQVAQSWFQDNLKKDPLTLKYLDNRGFTPEQIVEYGFGVSPNSPDALLQHIKLHKYTAEEATTASLAFKARNGRYYDFYQHRLTIPIHDKQGRLIAFGGRTLGDDVAKYKNSRDTPLFDKSATLYGFHKAKDHIHKNKRAILVEGYMDTLAMWSHNFGETLACLGTSLTQGHLRSLSQVTQHLILLFDGDMAGERASLRTVSLAMEFPSVDIRVVRLPQKHDPDSFTRENGPTALESLLKDSVSLIEFAIQQKLATAHGLDIPHLIKKEFIPWLRSVLDPIQRAYLCHKIAEGTGVDEGLIRSSLANKKEPIKPHFPHPSTTPLQPPAPQILRELSRAEREIIGHLYWSHPSELDLVWLEENLTKEHTWDEVWLAFVLELIHYQKSQQEPISVDYFESSHLPPIERLLESLKKSEAKYKFEEVNRMSLIHRVFRSMKLESLKSSRSAFRNLLDNSSQDPDETLKILTSIKEINNKIKEINSHS